MSQTRLVRSNSDAIIAGVCGGLAAYLNIDPVLVRLAFVILLFASGIGIPLYIILWVIMPRSDTAGQPGPEVIQKNLSEMGSKVSASIGNIGNPNLVGIVLILLGVYFLFSSLGWLQWLRSSLFWPMLIIALGAYLLIQRSREG